MPIPKRLFERDDDDDNAADDVNDAIAAKRALAMKNFMVMR